MLDVTGQTLDACKYCSLIHYSSGSQLLLVTAKELELCMGCDRMLNTFVGLYTRTLLERKALLVFVNTQ